jgi:hypothetical protein
MEQKFRRTAVPGAVVIGRLSKETLSRIAAATGATPKRDESEPGVMILEKVAGKARAAWEKVNDIVGKEGVVVPILEDDEGHRLLPTGRIEVRFKTPPAPKALEDFARRHGLKLAGQGRWNNAQASFALKPEDGRFLMEIVAALDADPETEAAWPDTRSAYRRGEAQAN